MEAKENEALLKAYKEAQGIAGLFPVNEDEDTRLYRLVNHIWVKAKEFVNS